MTSSEDLYRRLGVPADSSLQLIKAAYRSKARLVHPDLNPKDPHAERKFKMLLEAYQILSDGKQRGIYDRERGKAALGTSLRELWNAVLGPLALRPKLKPQTGLDAVYKLEISFREAVLGLITSIAKPSQTPCKTCDGRGAMRATGLRLCPACDGTKVVGSQGLVLMSWAACETCDGRGVVPDVPCEVCHGDGVESCISRLQFEIAPGVENGQRFRLAGEGLPGKYGGEPGNLYVDVEVRADRLLTRKGLDLLCEVDCPLWLSLVGGRLPVPFAEGVETIDLEPWFEHKKVLCFRGRGISDGEQQGDYYLTICASMPANLSNNTSALLKDALKQRVIGEFPRFDSYLLKLESDFDRE